VLIRIPRTLPISIVKKLLLCAIAPVYWRSSCQADLFESLKPLRLTKPARASRPRAGQKNWTGDQGVEASDYPVALSCRHSRVRPTRCSV